MQKGIEEVIIGVGSNSSNGSCEKGISLEHLYYYYYVYIPGSLLAGMYIPYLFLYVSLT